MANHDATSPDFFFYDVFLSFRGGTRYGFTDHLYEALCRHGINTFRDDEKLRVGDEIRPALLKAIDNSRISVVVLCENYASSTWCLDELVKIIECHDKKERHVSAIFYKVEPTNVRHQKGKYAEDMAIHEKRFGQDSEKVKAWKSALSRVCELSGVHCKENTKESQVIEKIVAETLDELPSMPFLIKHPVGLDSLFEKIKPILDIGMATVSMLGIHGAGGIGKTTLAVHLYNKIRDQFQSASFLQNVREKSSKVNGIEDLQRTLLSEMGENMRTEIGSSYKGDSEIKRRLGHKRVLLVLDDVDEVKQLESLAGGLDWFGSGSRIIITTRDTAVLDKLDVRIERFNMEELDYHDSLELFCWHAFNMSEPGENFEDISKLAASYAKGFPLALKVIGSNLKGRSIEEWEMQLAEYKKVPDSEIQGVLEISYNSLSDLQKEIFLDVACFFKGENWEYVKRILEACDFYPAIRVFVRKSLINIDREGCLEMHDLIQDMGREIVRRKSPLNPGDRSRLWSHEEILQVLTEDEGCSTIEGIILDPPQLEEVDHWNTFAFEKMRKLRILIIRNTRFSTGPSYLPNRLRLLDWEGCPLLLFPTSFYPKRIVDIHLPFSRLILEKPFKKFEDLTFINLSDCQSITQIPDVSQAKSLRTLTLHRCNRLVEFDKSVGFMPKLVYLSASGCTALKRFVPDMYLASLEMLYFDFCSSLEQFPNVVRRMDKPLQICVRGTAIQQLPDSIGNLTGLEYIDMSFCQGLRDLPRNFFLLPKLVTLHASGCSLLGGSFTRSREIHSIPDGCSNLKTLYFSDANLTDEDLDVILEVFPKLKDLRASGNNFISLPKSIKIPVCLKRLDVSRCKNLKEIPELSPSIERVDAAQCWSLTSEASTSLSSKVGKENDRFEVVMPNKMEIPQWFDHVCNDGIPHFWARRKFPAVALAFVFGEFSSGRGLFSVAFRTLDCRSVDLHLFIDGREACRKAYQHFAVGENHVLMCDLRAFFNDEEWQDLDASLGDDWKAVQIYSGPKLILREWGVFVYKQQTNIEDIKFSLPIPNSSIPCEASVLDQRIQERIGIHNLFDDITVNSPMGANFLGDSSNFSPSHITYDASLNQQKQDFTRRLHVSMETILPPVELNFGAVMSNPEKAKILVKIGEQLLKATEREPMSPQLWIEAMASSNFEDNQLMQLMEVLHPDAAAATIESLGESVTQQDEASSSSQIPAGLLEKEFIDVSASTLPTFGQTQTHDEISNLFDQPDWDKISKDAWDFLKNMHWTGHRSL